MKRCTCRNHHRLGAGDWITYHTAAERQPEIEELRSRVAAICDRLEIDPSSAIDPVVSHVISERDALQHENRQQQNEIKRLTKCLVNANMALEKYKRGWYLRGDEIERLTEELAVSKEKLIAHDRWIVQHYTARQEQQAEIERLKTKLRAAMTCPKCGTAEKVVAIGNSNQYHCQHCCWIWIDSQRRKGKT